jgi:hypothetical protein
MLSVQVAFADRMFSFTLGNLRIPTNSEKLMVPGRLAARLLKATSPLVLSA